MSAKDHATDANPPNSLAEANQQIDALKSELARERQYREQTENDARCFHELAQHIPEVFWMTNPAGDELVYISPAYEKIWGQSCQSLHEDPGRRLAWVHDADRQRVLKTFKRDASAGCFREIYRIERPDGQVRWIHDRAFPVPDGAGNIYRIAGIALDITERIEANDQTATLHSRIEGRNRMSVFAALGSGLAHDISQPLTAARNYIASVARANRQGSADNSALDNADREIEHAIAVIRHLRDFAREGKPTLSQQPIEHLLHDVYLTVDPELRASGIRYTGPRALGGLELPIDRIFIQQVMRNMLVNAMESFDDEQTSRRAIEVSVHTDHPDHVDIEIANNGPGIHKGVDLFEPFVTTKDHGLGLGLAVSRTLARSHGGDLFVADRGRGAGAGQSGDVRTCFVLRLPRHAGPEPHEDDYGGATRALNAAAASNA